MDKDWMRVGEVVRFGLDNRAAVIIRVKRYTVELSYSDEFDERVVTISKKYVRPAPVCRDRV